MYCTHLTSCVHLKIPKAIAPSAPDCSAMNLVKYNRGKVNMTKAPRFAYIGILSLVVDRWRGSGDETILPQDTQRKTQGVNSLESKH